MKRILSIAQCLWLCFCAVNKQEYNGGEDYVDAEAFRQDWYTYAEGDAKTEMIDLFIDNSGDTIDWLVYDHGFWFCQPRKEKETEFRVCMDFVFDGKKEKEYDYPRAFGNRVEAVSSYFDQLMADYTALGGQYMLETRGVDDLTDESGAKVTGVRAIGSDGTEYTIRAGAVIIATGGFAGSKDMMERYVTEPTGVATSWPIFGYTINDGVMGKDAQYLHPITGDSLYAFKCINYTYGADGGLDVDLDLNVLRADGSKIDGLYATGYDCSGVLYNSNRSYVDYGGSALGWAFTSGRLAGENAVNSIAK